MSSVPSAVLLQEPSKHTLSSKSENSHTLDAPQILKASKALLGYLSKKAHEKSANSSKPDLLTDEERSPLADTPVWLSVTTKRHVADSERLKPSRIALPHPLNADNALTICLITVDPQRTYKDIVASSEFPISLRKRITRVISLTKLRAKFRQYEAQRKLLAEHDIFLGDERIINLLPRMLGKTFYKSTTKRPIPVKLAARSAKPKGMQSIMRGADKEPARPAATATAIAAEIEHAISAAAVNLKPSTQIAIRIGCASWPAERIAANAEATANALVDRFIPEKWRNVRNIFIKGTQTASLPIWSASEIWLHEADVVLAAESSEATKTSKTLASEL